jgi:hypothetical protein
MSVHSRGQGTMPQKSLIPNFTAGDLSPTRNRPQRGRDSALGAVQKFVNVPIWEWEKIPRLQAKTLVGLRHEKLPQNISFGI